MANVYISYFSADADRAQEIHRWLAEDGHYVSIDSDVVSAVGNEWETRLYKRFRRADAVVCVVTPGYLQSAWCAAEIGAARALGLEILPVRFSSERLEDRTQSPDQYAYVDATGDPSDARERLQARLSAIDEQGHRQALSDAHRLRTRARFDEERRGALAQRLANGIFVCYRREDSRWQAGRLADALAQQFGENAVFMDVDRVRIGNWRKQVDEALAECAAVIVVMGPLWQAELESRPAIRDQVRYEITQALRLGKIIIPVAVDRARLPDHSELPDDIAAITDAQGYELGLDVMWRPTVGKLLDDLSALLQDNSATQ